MSHTGPPVFWRVFLFTAGVLLSLGSALIIGEL